MDKEITSVEVIRQCGGEIAVKIDGVEIDPSKIKFVCNCGLEIRPRILCGICDNDE